MSDAYKKKTSQPKSALRFDVPRIVNFQHAWREEHGKTITTDTKSRYLPRPNKYNRERTRND